MVVTHGSFRESLSPLLRPGDWRLVTGDVTELQVISGLQRPRLVTVSCGGQAGGGDQRHKQTYGRLSCEERHTCY